MLSIQESINKINEEKDQVEDKMKNNRDKGREIELLLEFFTMSFTELIKQIASLKYNVNVDFPTVQVVKGAVSVEGLTSLLHAINELQTYTKKNKVSFPDTQKIEGKVTISNPTPETKIPEYPKQIKTDVTSLPKYVGDKLDEIKKELSKIDVRPQVNVETKASEVRIDLESIKKGLESVVEAISRIETTPEVNIDLKDVISACDKTTKAINNLKFPVPSFKSSWTHSLTMRSEDLDKTYAWTTDGGKDVIDYIIVTDEDGGRYKRTYSYDGTGKVASETKWTRV